MSIARAGTPGATRVCPHCKAVVLETAAVCPGCRHHLRFNAADAALAAGEAYCAFNIEGTIAHKQVGEHCEYCIVLDIRNERGEQILRQVVGVGALHPGELRRLNLAVEMLPVRATVAPKSDQAAARDPRRTTVPSPAPTAARSPAPVASVAPTAKDSHAPLPPTPVTPSTPAKGAPTTLAAPMPATAAAASAATKGPEAAKASPSTKDPVPAGQASRSPTSPGSSPNSEQLRLFRKP